MKKTLKCVGVKKEQKEDGCRSPCGTVQKDQGHKCARSIFIAYAVFQNLLGGSVISFQFDHAVSPLYLYQLKIANI